MKQHNKEEKKKYLQGLRDSWQKAKELSKTKKFEALFLEATKSGLKVSQTGLTFCKLQMEGLGLEGIPYIDAKTFKAWKTSGFVVKKGEKSKIKGVTFLRVDEKDEDSYMYPKSYSLFHKSQVESLK